MTNDATWPPPIFPEWLAALEARHLADLRIAEVTRALRAVSSAYVERRHSRAGPGTRRAIDRTLDSAGKRAAFALFYAPLHFLVVGFVVRTLGAEAPTSILDIGCGTGAGGAAWSVATGSTSPVVGIDRHPWAVEEARWTYRTLKLSGRARVGDVTRLPSLRRGDGAIAAYVLNELPEAARQRVEDQLVDAAGRGAHVLIVEPIARALTPWWERTAARVAAAGGRADEWRFTVELPPLLKLLDKAGGLDHRELTARSLYL